MRKMIYALLLTGLSLIAQAQDSLYIYKAGNVVFKTPMINVDSIRFRPITFDSLYVYHAGGIFYRRAIGSTDSIAFDTPPSVPNTVVDTDGNSYRTVKIGTQVWMAENLKVTNYTDGIPIPLVEKLNDWSWLNSYNNQLPELQGMCWYDNDQATYVAKGFGALYNWYVVNTGKLCPTGWHVPSNDEWLVLINGWGGADIAGDYLKSKTGWLYGGNGYNTSGFNGTSAGYRSYTGYYGNVGNGYFWTSTESYSTNAYARVLSYIYSSAGYANANKGYGYSVRCLKD